MYILLPGVYIYIYIIIQNISFAKFRVEISRMSHIISLALNTRPLLCRERVGTINTFCNISSEKYNMPVSSSAQSKISAYKSKEGHCNMSSHKFLTEPMDFTFR